MSDVNADLLAALKKIRATLEGDCTDGARVTAGNIAIGAIEAAERDAPANAEREQDAMNELDGEFSIPAEYQ